MNTILARHLRPGDRIPTTLCGDLSVIAYPLIDHDPEWPRTYVDVEVEDKSGRWDVERLPAAARAEAFEWRGLAPLRYRLTYLTDAVVAWEAALVERTVKLISRQGGLMTVVSVPIPAVCPTCGGPRGLPYNHLVYDDQAHELWVHRWDNPCGHIDAYDALVAEAEGGRSA